MEKMNYSVSGDVLTIALSGRIDSSNAAQAEAAIQTIRTGNPCGSLRLDCDALEYISSAGLRVILRCKKAVPDTGLINVSSEVYDVLAETPVAAVFSVCDDEAIVSSAEA